MKQYRPNSYSKQARLLSNTYFYQWENKEEALNHLRHYDNTLITQRAIKNFMRKYKKYLDKKAKGVI